MSTSAGCAAEFSDEIVQNGAKLIAPSVPFVFDWEAFFELEAVPFVLAIHLILLLFVKCCIINEI